MIKTFSKFSRTRLKALRSFHGLSHEAFGQKIGKTKQTIIAWEKGRTAPGVEDLDTMANVFGIDPTSFWVKDEFASK